MKRISQNDTPQQILSTLTALTTSEELKQSRANPSDEAKRYNNEVFKRIIAICPAWKQAFTTADAAKDARREWLIGFSDAENITSDAIESALKRLREKGSPFMPTIGEFLVWCEESNLPVGTLNGKDSYDEWYRYDSLPLERREPSDLTQATYHTMSVIFGAGMKGHLTASKPADALKYWCSRYETTINKLKEGRPLKEAPAPAHKLDHIRQPASKSTAMSALAAMRKGL